jgi:hypothetical protein
MARFVQVAFFPGAERRYTYEDPFGVAVGDYVLVDAMAEDKPARVVALGRHPSYAGPCKWLKRVLSQAEARELGW